MRLLILLAGVLLGTASIADTDVRVDRIELKSAIADSSDDTTDVKEETAAPQTRAQDYNSSRSNTSANLDTDDDGDSVPTEDECTNAVDNDCTGTTDDAEKKATTARK